MDSPTSSRIRLGDIVGARRDTILTSTTTATQQPFFSSNSVFSLRDTSPEPSVPLSSFRLLSPSQAIPSSHAPLTSAFTNINPSGTLPVETPLSQRVAARITSTTEISPRRESHTTSTITQFNGGHVQEIVSTSPRRATRGFFDAGTPTETVTTRKATTSYDSTNLGRPAAPPPLRWDPNVVTNQVRTPLGATPTTNLLGGTGLGGQSSYSSSTYNVTSSPLFRNILSSSTPYVSQTSPQREVVQPPSVQARSAMFVDVPRKTPAAAANPIPTPNVSEVPFATVMLVPRNKLNPSPVANPSQGGSMPMPGEFISRESSPIRQRVVDHHQAALANKRRSYYQNDISGMETIPDTSMDRGIPATQYPPPPVFQPNAVEPDYQSPWDESRPVLPEATRSRAAVTPWYQHPGHDVILLAIQARGVTPHSHPDLVDYHMAPELLNSIQRLKIGSYFIKYPRKGGTPHERFFSVRILPDKYRRLQPYLVWSLHESAVQILDRVLLTELVYLTTDVTASPAFVPHLRKNCILGPFVGNQRRPVPSQYAFTLYFMNRKTKTNRTVDLLTIDGQNHEVWVNALSGILAVNSVSVAGEDRASELKEVQLMVSHVNREDAVDASEGRE